MKKVTIFFIMMFLPVIAHPLHAALHDRGGGLIYDDVMDITWMQNANYTGITMIWDDAMNWADNLVFHDYDDWRLPATDASCSGNDCTGSEMGHLFYDENVTSDAGGWFTDVKPYMYWSGTDDGTDASRAWRFNFSSGSQGTSSKALTRYAWAVRDGDTAGPVAPEPVSSVLFLSGGATMAARCFRQKQRQVS